MAVFNNVGDGAPTTTGYDQVTVKQPSGEVKFLTRRAFEELPLHERVRAILNKQVKFYRDGHEIVAREALGKG